MESSKDPRTAFLPLLPLLLPPPSKMRNRMQHTPNVSSTKSVLQQTPNVTSTKSVLQQTPNVTSTKRIKSAETGNDEDWEKMMATSQGMDFDMTERSTMRLPTFEIPKNQLRICIKN